MKTSKTTVENVSAQKKATNALERVTALEESVERLAMAMKKFFDDTATQVNRQGHQMAQAIELVDAVVKHIGAEAVGKIVEENRIERANKEMERSKAALNDAIEKGLVKAAEVIGDNSLLAAVEIKPDGSVVPPGRFQYHISQIEEPARSQLLGGKVGHEVATPAGNVFKVVEIYDVVEPPEVPQDEPAAPEAVKE